MGATTAVPFGAAVPQIIQKHQDQGDDNSEGNELSRGRHLLDSSRDTVPLDGQLNGSDEDTRDCQAAERLDLSQYPDASAAVSVSLVRNTRSLQSHTLPFFGASTFSS